MQSRSTRCCGASRKETGPTCTFHFIDPNATNGKNPLSAQSTSIGPDQQHLWCRTQIRAFGAIRSCQRIREERLNRLALVGKVPRSPFRLFGTASVGSQSLTGIARLHRLRNDPKLAHVSAVWPLETGWATKAKWLPAHISVLHAEIYPSVLDPLPDEIKDRGQVRAMWQWARDLDRDNLLWREFCRPIEVETGSKGIWRSSLRKAGFSAAHRP